MDPARSRFDVINRRTSINMLSLEHIAVCEEKQQRQRDIETSRDYECGICNERIIENGRKFGLLGKFVDRISLEYNLFWHY